MENLIQTASVPAIVAIVYVLIEGYKAIVNGKANCLRFIPLIAAVAGAVLGVVAFYLAPNIILAKDVFTAILVGGASGLAATGTNQIFKQLSKDKVEKNDGNTK